jgi:hypothetical protein
MRPPAKSTGITPIRPGAERYHDPVKTFRLQGMLTAILVAQAICARGQETRSAAALTEEWLEQEPRMPVVQLTQDDAAVLEVLLPEWRVAAARSHVALTIARDLNQYDNVTKVAIERAFDGKISKEVLAAILSDLTRRNSRIQTLGKEWTVKDAIVVTHRVQMLLEYGAHAPDDAAVRRLQHFKSLVLPGYDLERTRAIILYSQSWEIENQFRGLIAVYLEKSGRTWRIIARHEFSEHDHLLSVK